MNYLRNDTTGAQYNFDSMPQNQNALLGALDYTSGPVDVNGRKGYRLKSDGMTVVFDDGSKAMLGVDRKASREANMDNLNMEKAGLSNKLLQAQITAAGQKEGPTYQNVDTADGMMAFNPKTGEMKPVMGANGQPMQGKSSATEDEKKAAGYALRMNSALNLSNQIAQDDPSALKPGLMERAASVFSEPLANTLRSENRQRIDSANTDALDAALTLATGAAYTKEQLAGLSKAYFPQIGDGEETVKDKNKRFNETIQTARLRAGKMNPQLDKLMAPQGGGAGVGGGATAQAISEARAAIARGASRDKVVQRLQQLGVTDFGGI